jgi:hypothetical protein
LDGVRAGLAGFIMHANGLVSRPAMGASSSSLAGKANGVKRQEPPNYDTQYDHGFDKHRAHDDINDRHEHSQRDSTMTAIDPAPLPHPHPHPRSKIYAITGLGSSDPQMKLDALMGKAALDGWLIKGRDTLMTVKYILNDMLRERERRGEGS